MLYMIWPYSHVNDLQMVICMSTSVADVTMYYIHVLQDAHMRVV